MTSTHKLGGGSFILMIRMVTLGPFRNYLRAANLKSRSKYVLSLKLLMLFSAIHL